MNDSKNTEIQTQPEVFHSGVWIRVFPDAPDADPDSLEYQEVNIKNGPVLRIRLEETELEGGMTGISNSQDVDTLKISLNKNNIVLARLASIPGATYQGVVAKSGDKFDINLWQKVHDENGRKQLAEARNPFTINPRLARELEIFVTPPKKQVLDGRAAWQ